MTGPAHFEHESVLIRGKKAGKARGFRDKTRRLAFGDKGLIGGDFLARFVPFVLGQHHFDEQRSKPHASR